MGRIGSTKLVLPKWRKYGTYDRHFRVQKPSNQVRINYLWLNMKLLNQTAIFGHPPSHVCFTVFLAINGFYCCFCLTKKKKVDVHNSRGFSLVRRTSPVLGRAGQTHFHWAIRFINSPSKWKLTLVWNKLENEFQTKVSFFSNLAYVSNIRQNRQSFLEMSMLLPHFLSSIYFGFSHFKEVVWRRLVGKILQTWVWKKT